MIVNAPARRRPCLLPWLASLLLAGAAQAGAEPAQELYHYQDPFGKWRTLTVAPGMAQRYYTAQKRDAPGAGKSCPACQALPGPTPDQTVALQVVRLQAHPGRHDLQQVIGKAAQTSGLDQSLIGAVIAIESGFRQDARSPKGALGLMQLMPRTAQGLIDTPDVEAALVDPGVNVAAGTRHLRRLVDKYPGRLELALAAYNAGEGAVARYDGIPPYQETQAYVRNVMALYRLYDERPQSAAASGIRTRR